MKEGECKTNHFRISDAIFKSIPAMIGEIFTEEERYISAIYEGILRAVASGNTVSTEISSYLFSRFRKNQHNSTVS